MVLLLNTAYLLTLQPYAESSAAHLDKINSCFLLFFCVLTATYSSWNTDSTQRFEFGMGFDCVIGLQFVVNLVYVLS